MIYSCASNTDKLHLLRETKLVGNKTDLCHIIKFTDHIIKFLYHIIKLTPYIIKFPYHKVSIS